MKQKHTVLITIVSLLVLLVLAGAGLLSNSSYRERILNMFLITPEKLPIPAPPKYVAPVRNLTSDEQTALNIPLHSASDVEKQQHAAEVVKLATTAPELDITGCKPTPLVYKVALNGSFKIKNSDPIPHTVRYLSLQIAVPAQGTTTVKTSQLFKTAGDYGYGCDNPFAKMGVLMVR